MTQIYRELMYRRVEPYRGDYMHYVTDKNANEKFRLRYRFFNETGSNIVLSVLL